MHDVFISYEKETKTIADNICNTLEKNNIRCWYAPRDVEGEYAQAIVNAIRNSKVFILILTGKSSRSNHVLNEVETAYKEMENNPLVILPFKLTDEVLSDAMTYYIKRFHWIDAASCDLNAAIGELLEKTKNILGIKQETKAKGSRESNKYFTFEDKYELKRLEYQRALLNKITEKVYAEHIKDREDIVILDVGSNDGYLTNEIAKLAKSSVTIGLEFDGEAVDYANEKYGSDSLFFHQCDVEEEDFEEKLEGILSAHNLERIDALHISMVLLHLKNPFRVLRILRKFLRPSAVVIIKDIDDGFTIAHPDPQRIFSRAIEIVGRTPTWGYRQSGREIYTLLKKLNFRNINLEHIGVTTMNLSFWEKEALYHTYFGAILADVENCLKKEPHNLQYIEDRNWLVANKDEMEEQFFQESFFFILGFVVFTATAE